MVTIDRLKTYAALSISRIFSEKQFLNADSTKSMATVWENSWRVIFLIKVFLASVTLNEDAAIAL
jgi:hypothetical protein